METQSFDHDVPRSRAFRRLLRAMPKMAPAALVGAITVLTVATPAYAAAHPASNVFSRQSISFTSTPPSPAQAGGSYTVSAVGGLSGRPVTFSIDPGSTAGACSVSGSVVTFAGTGDCVIDANQAGSDAFYPAPQAQQTVLVVTAATIGAATAANASASVGFSTAVSSAGDPITAYTVTATDHTTAAHGGQTATGTASPVTVAGLTNGDSYTFTVTASYADGTGPTLGPSNTVIPDATVSFAAVPGSATDIAMGADGSAWTIGTNPMADGYGIYQWSGTTGWVEVPGAAVSIAVGPDGSPWVVNAAHQIFHLTGTTWTQYPGAATDIAVGANGSVWITGTDQLAEGYGIFEWSGTAWAQVSGAAVSIAVGPDGSPWVVNAAGQIYHLTGTTWTQYPGAATDIAVGANGSVWITGTDQLADGYGIFEWSGTAWDQVPGSAVSIAVAANGYPWVVNSANAIYAG
jgi:Tectonin domain/Fibronectin type III domain